MNLLTSNHLLKSVQILSSARLFGINPSILSSNLKFFSSQFYPISHNAVNIVSSGNEAMPHRVKSDSQKKLKKILEYVEDKIMYIKRSNQKNKLAFFLYRTIETIDFDEFYRVLEMPDTFNSWFVIVELHVWMLMSQVMDGHSSGVALRNEIVRVMWMDIDTRLNNIGYVKKKILTQQVKELHGRLSVALWVYDEGLLGSDMVLAGALWYKFFDKDCDDPFKLEVLVRYVRHQIQHLSILNIRDYDSVKDVKNMWEPFSTHVKAVRQS